MLKALKGIKKKLGSSGKLQEAAAADAAAAPPAAAAPAPTHALPPGLPRPPSPAIGQGAMQQQQPQLISPAAPAAAAAEGSGRPASPPLAAAACPQEELGGGLVDYELVVGPLELDTAEESEVPGGTGGPPAAEAPRDSMDQHPTDEPHQVCYGSDDPTGSLAAAVAAEQEAAAAAEAAAAGEEGGAAGPSGGAAGAAAEGAAAAAAGGGGELSEALAAMMYLTEDAEGNDDCVSVVSGGCCRGAQLCQVGGCCPFRAGQCCCALEGPGQAAAAAVPPPHVRCQPPALWDAPADAVSDDRDFPDDISELSRALEALEGEALAGSSPGGEWARVGGRPQRTAVLGAGRGSQLQRCVARAQQAAAGVSEDVLPQPSSRGRPVCSPLPSCAPAAPSAGGSGSLDDQLAERLGISPEGDPSGGLRCTGRPLPGPAAFPVPWQALELCTSPCTDRCLPVCPPVPPPLLSLRSLCAADGQAVQQPGPEDDGAAAARGVAGTGEPLPGVL